MPLNYILRKCTAWYKLSESQEYILMFMDDIKLFAKNEKELETLTQTVRTYSQDIGKEFGIEKYVMLVTKTDKRHMTEGAKLPNQIIIKTIGEKETYKYRGMLKADTIKQVEIKKKKLEKCISEKNKKSLEQKLYIRNLVKGINTWAVSLER